MNYETLKGTATHELFRAFVEAFSDYSIKLHLSHSQFEAMLKRRGFDPDASVGAFAELGHELVGFILNGVRSWNGKLTAYDLGTGIVPSHRKQGHSPLMFQRVLDALTNQNVEQYLLEVLQNNKIAFALYKKQGFSVTRHFSCFVAEHGIRAKLLASRRVDFDLNIEPAEWERRKQFWDFIPSWQNSIDSVCAAPDSFLHAVVRIDGEIAGYGVMEKTTGDIPQLAVQKKHRRKGIATSILAAFADRLENGVPRVINVADDCTAMKLLLKQTGFTQFGSQYEMLLSGLQRT